MSIPQGPTDCRSRGEFMGGESLTHICSGGLPLLCRVYSRCPLTLTVFNNIWWTPSEVPLQPTLDLPWTDPCYMR